MGYNKIYNYYIFPYTLNPESATDSKKKKYLAKTCQQLHLESLFANLPSYFPKNLDGSRGYFLEDRTDPQNEQLPHFVARAILSCIAIHMCSRLFFEGEKEGFRQPFDLSRKYNIYTSPVEVRKNLDYGMEANLKEALKQLSIGTAEDFWLDVWAAYFLSHGRVTGETDAGLRQRIVQSIQDPKNIIRVITDVLKLYLGTDVTVSELCRTGIDGAGDVKPSFAPALRIKKIGNIVIPDSALWFSSVAPLTPGSWPGEGFIKCEPILTANVLTSVKLYFRYYYPSEYGDAVEITSSQNNVILTDKDGNGSVSVNVTANFGAQTGLGNPLLYDDPSAGGLQFNTLEQEFEITDISLKNVQRCADRLVVNIPLPEPPAYASWVTTTPGSSGVYDVEDWEWFVRDPVAAAFTTGTTINRQDGDAYIVDYTLLAGFQVAPATLRAIMRSVKAAGVKLYYKVGNDFVII